MTIQKFEQVIVNRVTRNVDSFSDNTELLSLWFATRGHIHDIRNPLKLKEFYRQYTSFLDITLNYTPNTYLIGQDNSAYAFNVRTKDWRVIDAVENARTSITFLCYDANKTIAP